jgi:hypothetical protein
MMLWTDARPFPPVEEIPLPDRICHLIVHRAEQNYAFLHGAAIVRHNGVFYCAWANSPVDENSTAETLRGRRSADGGRSWSPVEMIASGTEGERNNSHCALLSVGGDLWAFAASFEKLNTRDKVFPGLRTEAFVLDQERWSPKGVVAEDFWPYEEPTRMENGDWIMGGQDSASNTVVAVSHGDNLLHWATFHIPTPENRTLKFGETTVIVDPGEITAVIRYKPGLIPSIPQQLALVSKSRDYGKTWTEAEASNLPMGDSKAYAGILSTGQRYLVCNAATEARRSALIVLTGEPGARVFSGVWRIRHGYPPNLKWRGFAKSSQWSYPYAREYDGQLYVVYSIGKEDCGLSIIPLSSLKV